MTLSSTPSHQINVATGAASPDRPGDGAPSPARIRPKGRRHLWFAEAERRSDPVEAMPSSKSSAPTSRRALPLWLLLVGREAVHRRWGAVTSVGLIWTGLGGALVIDALDGATHIPDRWFGLLLVFEAASSGVRGLVVTGAARRLRLLKAAILLVVAVLTMLASASSTFLLAMLFGTAFLFDGLLRVVLSHVLRFPGWHGSVVHGSFGILLGILTLQPYPTWYAGTVGFSIGAFLMLSGIKVMVRGLRLRRPPSFFDTSEQASGSDTVKIYVWTPTGTATIPARRRLVHRYVISVDGVGHLSTGHAALELAVAKGAAGSCADLVGEDPLYISHYPSVEIERSPDKLRAILRAGPENDVPGRFLPSYREEAADWCEATVVVTLQGIDGGRLRAFWSRYRRDATYNLVGRNCSTCVVDALDAAVEGNFCSGGRPWRRLARAMVSPEFWAAALMRNGAGAMTWTPGLVLDYTRALGALTDPVAPVPTIKWQGVRRRLMRNERAETVARQRGLIRAEPHEAKVA